MITLAVGLALILTGVMVLWGQPHRRDLGAIMLVCGLIVTAIGSGLS